MNDLQRARNRAMARRAAQMAAEGNTVGARIQLKAMRVAQAKAPRLIETDEQVKDRLRNEFLAGEYEQVS